MGQLDTPAAGDDPEMIRTVALTKVYPGTDFKAVDSLDLSVHAGEIFGLLGPNGAGKTTTAGMLTTRVVPTSGSAYVGGIDVVAKPALAKQLIGVVSQQNTLDRQLTVWENLYFHGRLFGLSARTSRETADRVLEQFHLTKWARASVYALSGGMAQRLMVARSIAHRPAVLFMDEPTAGLDPQSRLALWDVLGEAQPGRSDDPAHNPLYGGSRPSLRAGRHHGSRPDPGPGHPRRPEGDSGCRHHHRSASIRQPRRPGQPFEEGLEGLTRVRPTDAGVELHVKGGPGLLPRVVTVADRGGFEVADVSVTEPTLETVFINLTGKELRD